MHANLLNLFLFSSILTFFCSRCRSDAQLQWHFRRGSDVHSSHSVAPQPRAAAGRVAPTCPKIGASMPGRVLA